MNSLKSLGRLLAKYSGDVSLVDFALFGLLSASLQQDIKKVLKG